HRRGAPAGAAAAAAHGRGLARARRAPAERSARRRREARADAADPPPAPGPALHGPDRAGRQRADLAPRRGRAAAAGHHRRAARARLGGRQAHRAAARRRGLGHRDLLRLRAGLPRARRAGDPGPAKAEGGARARRGPTSRRLISPMTLSYAHVTSTTPLLGETIGENLDRAIERFGDRDALVVRHQDVRLSYAELG